MKGQCVVCEEAAEALCVGCKKRPAFLCERHANPCQWCGHEGPYCLECKACAVPECFARPGVWKCCSCSKRILPGSFRKKCIDCNTNWRCNSCVRLCECGHDPDHYICIRSILHQCEYPKCTRMTCDTHGTFELAVGSVRLCAEHLISAKRRRKELADDE